MNWNQEKPLVLVVDDDPTGRLMMRSALEDSDFEVVDCADGARALALFAERKPDVTILDVLMPGMDGFEVCSRLRGTSEGRHAPILLVTGLDDLDSINRAYEVGATDFATKPIAWALLGHRVRYLLRAHLTLLKLHESESWLARAQRLAHLGHWELELPSGEYRSSAEIGRILGLPEPITPSRADYLEALEAEDRSRLQRCHQEIRRAGGRYDLELRLHRRDGKLRFVRDQGEALAGEAGRVTGLRGTIQDVTQLREAEEHARFLDRHDALTGLANRNCFADWLASTLLAADARGEKAAVLCIDLAEFRRVNDTLGHGVGDVLLRRVAAKLSVALPDRRGSAGEAGNGTMLARGGGNEFLVGLAGPAQDDAARHAERLLEALGEAFSVGGQQVFLRACIGAAVFPGDGAAADELISAAASAAHQVKRAGQTGYRFYDASMLASASRRLSLEGELRRALDANELRLYLQPQIDTQTQRLVGAEALVRWEHAVRGLVLPQDFIPFAEESGLIVRIGAWMLRASCEQLARWRAAGLEPPVIAVNVSSRELLEPGLERRVATALDGLGLPPSCLELEITETALLNDTESARRTLHDLRGRGIRVCLDDFGTGYASLSYLKRFPFDSLKIDRSFVKDVVRSRHDAAIVSSIVALAQSLGLGTVAEGVETEEQRELLRSRGCRVMQGFLFERPVPAERFEHLLRINDRSAARSLAAAG